MATARSEKPYRSMRGFTLIEALVVIAILTVLAGLAAPSFNNLFERYRVETAREELIGALQLARTEAIRQGQAVIVERQTGCAVTLTANQDWSCGWIIYTDLNNDNARDSATEPILQAYESHPGVLIMKSGNPPLAYIRSDRFGQLGIGLHVLIQPRNGAAANGSILCISAGSRIRTIKGATSCIT